MNVLVVNAGSASLKARLVDPHDNVVDSLDLGEWTAAEETTEIERFVRGLSRVDAVGHRIVHGGTEFDGPVLIDQQVREHIAALSELAPLHQPRGVAGIDAVTAVLPAAPAVACFDTAFHQSIPAAAATYALPRMWNERWSLRRYGFHGLSHDYAAHRAADMLHRDVMDLRIVTCHLGAGASLAAVSGGQSVDTTMGYTPLDGLVMASRPGSLDPGLVLWLLRHGDMDLSRLTDALEHESGLTGLAGGSGDMRDVWRDARAGDPHARESFDIYIHRLRREIAAMAAAMNGLDVLVFTGGIGEHQPPVRAAAAEGLGFLGIGISAETNEKANGDSDITADHAAVTTLVLTAREDVAIARQTRALLSEHH